MREEHFLNLRGKRYVLYEGLLDKAHEEGLHGIETELVQVPTEENRQTAIVKAKIIVERNSTYQTFTGYGDASPTEEADSRRKGPASTAPIRLAETRAKARALRDAVNVGTTSLEEIPENDASPQEARPAPREQTQDGQRSGPRGLATPKQLDYLKSLLKDVSAFEDHVGKPMNELTKQEATGYIEQLRNRASS